MALREDLHGPMVDVLISLNRLDLEALAGLGDSVEDKNTAATEIERQFDLTDNVTALAQARGQRGKTATRINTLMNQIERTR